MADRVTHRSGTERDGGRLTPMPHVSDVRTTSHDRHDPMLVAALAAGDLAATDRDRAIALTRDLRRLRDASTTTSSRSPARPRPCRPPIATRPRDFRLTPEQAARLRPAGWRRFVGRASPGRGSPSASRSGVGLATLGLAGLLIGNVSLSFGDAASAPSRRSTRRAGGAANEAAATPARHGDGSEPGSQLGPMASGAAAPQAAAPSAASAPAAVPSPSDAASAASASAPDCVQRGRRRRGRRHGDAARVDRRRHRGRRPGDRRARSGPAPTRGPPSSWPRSSSVSGCSSWPRRRRADRRLTPAQRSAATRGTAAS